MSTTRIICIAVVSRMLCSTIAYLAKLFGKAYDSSSGLQVLGCSPTVDPSSLKTPGMPCIHPCILELKSCTFIVATCQSNAGLLRSHSVFVWDSVFFTRVALCGYEYEQYYAFFPFLPGEQNMCTPHALLQYHCGLLCQKLAQFAGLLRMGMPTGACAL